MDWLSILKAYVDSLESAVGAIEGATTLHNKLTAARAALLDEITALRLAELDPANIPGDIDTANTNLGDASGDTLISLVAKFGDDAVTLKARLDLIDAAIALLATTADLAALQGDVTTIGGIVSLLPDAGALSSLAQDLTVAKEATVAALNNLSQAQILSDATPFAGADIGTIKGLVDSAESAGPYSYLDAGGEQDVVVDAATTRRHIWLDFSNRNMTQIGTFRIYLKVNGTNYDLQETIAVTVGGTDLRAFIRDFTVNQEWKLTYEEGVDEGAARDIPYNVITQVIE